MPLWSFFKNYARLFFWKAKKGDLVFLPGRDQFENGVDLGEKPPIHKMRRCGSGE
jgi:hypothetical protein